jgi:hypothetical protein
MITSSVDLTGGSYSYCFPTLNFLRKFTLMNHPKVTLHISWGLCTYRRIILLGRIHYISV